MNSIKSLGHSLTILIVLFFSIPLSSQKLIKYDCSKLDELPVFLDITYSSEPMEYFGQSFYILRYDLRLGSSIYHSFYTYKFNDKLYVLDDSAKTINYSKDQVLFDINSESSMLTSANGIFEDIELKLADRLLLNNKRFYFFATNSITFSYFNITRIIFDEDLDINALEVKSYLGTSQCVLKDIHVKLKNKTKRKSKNYKNSTRLRNIKFNQNWDKK